MNKLLLRGKVTLNMLAVGLAPLLVAIIVVLVVSSNAMTNKAFDQLDSLRDTKAGQIERYFQSIQDQLRTFSESLTVREAMVEFNNAFDNADRYTPAQLARFKEALTGYYRNEFGEQFKSQTGESVNIDPLMPTNVNSLIAQYNYIANNPNPLGSKSEMIQATSGLEYDRLHAIYHPIFKNYLEKFGYYDIFLVEPETGYVVYSVFKELDYATSLLTGPYANTNFARAFKTALETRQPSAVAVEDFAPYLPSYNAPASFMAVPIFDDSDSASGQDRLTGVLVFQAPVDRINEVMATNKGLGETGDTFLVGSDSLMRSQSRLSEEPTLLKTRVDTEAVRNALSGSEGTEVFTDHRGESALTSYAPLKIEGLNWVIIAQLSESEALAAVTQLMLIGAVIFLLVIPVVIFVAVRFARGVVGQLGGDPTELDYVAQEIATGNLNVDTQSSGAPEGVMASMIKMRDNLKARTEADKTKAAEIGRVKQALDKVSSNIMMADAEYNIIYVNDAAQTLFNQIESDLRQGLPNFNARALVGSNIDIFHKQPSHQRRMLDALASTYQADIVVGPRHMQVIANPVLSEEGVRLGTVVEWRDRTSEVLIQQEVADIVNASKAGDLTQRINLQGKTGFYGMVSSGVNELVDIADGVIRDTNVVLAAIASGDLTNTIERDYEGAFGELKNNANATVAKLTEIMAEIRSSADEVKLASEEIATGNRDLAARTEQQASSLEETAASMEQMTSSVATTASNSANARVQASLARDKATQGGEVINNAVKAVGEINEVSQKIATIINVIDEIAFQTNLLALNAAVEAARAGEQGRGFAVVASEVRSLAQRTASSAREIKDLIKDSLNKVEVGTELVHSSGDALNEIIAAVKDVSDLISEIANASEEQSAGIGQVNIAVAQMDSTTQQNAALVDEASAASESMTRKADSLNQLVSFFKVRSMTSPQALRTLRQTAVPKGVPSAPKARIQSPTKGASTSNEGDNWEEF